MKLKFHGVSVEEAVNRIVSGLRNYFASSGARKAIIGLSGGIDSTTTLFLLVKALGASKVLGLFLPSRVTKRQDFEDVKEITEKLGVELRVVNVEGAAQALVKQIGTEDKLVIGNMHARLRMTVLYAYSNMLNGLVVGTSNFTEFMLGYFTKFGDGACDILPIGNLYKTEVYQIARFLGVPEKIIKKVPSAGLWEGQTDEGELGLSYAEIDEILFKLLQGELKGDENEKVKRVAELMSKNEHKRRLPYVIKL